MIEQQNRLPVWVAERLRPLPPVWLRDVPLPEWTTADRCAFEPAGYAWDRNRQQWVTG